MAASCSRARAAGAGTQAELEGRASPTLVFEKSILQLYFHRIFILSDYGEYLQE